MIRGMEVVAGLQGVGSWRCLNSATVAVRLASGMVDASAELVSHEFREIVHVRAYLRRMWIQEGGK
jgi:hypothetical protein